MTRCSFCKRELDPAEVDGDLMFPLCRDAHACERWRWTHRVSIEEGRR